MSDSTAASAPVIGIDVGATNTQIGVVDAANAILGRLAVRTEADRGRDHVISNLAAGVRESCDAAGVSVGALGAVGIVIAGAIDIPNGIVLTGENLNWHDVPLRDLLQSEIDCPVVIDNDVNGAVWGEYLLGAGDGTGDALGVWVGTGIGGGLVLDGKLHHGEFFTAGEVGNTVIDPDGKPGRRTVEDLCSRRGMRSLLGDAMPDHPDSVLHEFTGDDPQRIGMDELKRAYEQGDTLTCKVVNRGAELLGIAIANWVTVLAMRTVFIGGGVTEALGEPYLKRIVDGFRADVFPDRCRDCRLLMTKLQADSGLLGAALLARRAVAST